MILSIPLKKLLILLGFILSPFLLSAQAPFVLITIPKSGSHMAIKALHLMTGTPPIWHTQFPSFWNIPPEKGFLYTHFCLSPQLEQNYRDLKSLKKIIMIRDLRDVAVSMVRQIQKAPWPGMSKEERDAFLQMPFDEQLLFVIGYEYDIYEVAAIAPNSNQVSLTRVAAQAIEYAQDPNNLVMRYENLIGEQGGGNEEDQLNELCAIASFIEIDLDPLQIIDIAKQLYGNDHDPFGKTSLRNYKSTFSKGKTGSWKTCFKEEHIRLFKEKLGDALILLDYEQNYNW